MADTERSYSTSPVYTTTQHCAITSNFVTISLVIDELSRVIITVTIIINVDLLRYQISLKSVEFRSDLTQILVLRVLWKKQYPPKLIDHSTKDPNPNCYRVCTQFVSITLSSRRESQSGQCINYVTGQNSATADAYTRLCLSSCPAVYTCVLVCARAHSCARDT